MSKLLKQGGADVRVTCVLWPSKEPHRWDTRVWNLIDFSIGRKAFPFCARQRGQSAALFLSFEISTNLSGSSDALLWFLCHKYADRHADLRLQVVWLNGVDILKVTQRCLSALVSNVRMFFFFLLFSFTKHVRMDWLAQTSSFISLRHE